MEALRARLRKIDEQGRKASNKLHKEVLEERARAKGPANLDKKLERIQKQIQKEQEREKAEELGQNFELQKSLDIRADEFEKWDKIKASKRRGDPGFIDFETATKRQYKRSIKELKPDIEKYEEIKKNLGEQAFYLNDTTVPKTSLIKDEQVDVDRMVDAVNKQIEIRNKKSRRRKFDDEADVDYINERNMKFNKKLERFYGSHTKEIKQNFERGTAL